MMRQQDLRARCLHGLALLLIATLAAPALADVYVIANPTLTVSAADVTAIYTGDKQLVGGVKLKPLDNHAGQAEFLSKVLQLNAGRYDSLWTMKSFRDGLTPPAVKATDLDVIAFVQSTPGAIGYITSAPPSGVTLLKKY
jgi:hypothetical protein